ncbi:MAG: dTDP-glucose 4,6-dehydratase [Flavobacteriales bacterium]
MEAPKNILITGGAGFIGSHLVRHFVTKYPNYFIVNVDKLTYAGNLSSLDDVREAKNYVFEKADICDEKAIQEIFDRFKITHVIHCAAESHVDRSILNPMEFVQTNVIGTVTMLNVAKNNWKDEKEHLFYHISTDEVYGSLGETGKFEETTSYDPRSPYSASKASSDHFVRAYHETFHIPMVLSNCSNNYGPNQFPEKLIPLCIQNIINNKSLPIYGKGENVRDWLYVQDHVEAIDLIFHKGKNGETYNIGGDNEWQNITLVKALCKIMDAKLNRAVGTSEKLINYVKDRQGHDMRYSIDFSKLNKELGWKPKAQFESGLEKTVDWYLANQQWVDGVITGEYKNYYKTQYESK